MSKQRIATGTGLSVGVILALPAGAQADDFTVTNLDDGAGLGPTGSLRRAIEDADANPGADRVLFASKLSGTISLTTLAIYVGHTGISGDIEIIGPGARQITVNALDGYPAFAPFANPYSTANPIDVSISGLTITGGNNTSGFFGTSGGGIQTYGDVDLTLSQMTITGNSADASGGGVATIPVGEPNNLTIESSTITGNSADSDGGGVFSYQGGAGELLVRNSTISGNEAGSYGGGAYLSSSNPDTDAFVNSTVAGNEAGAIAGGGGISAPGGGTIRGSIVAANTGGAPDLDDGPWATSFSLIGDTSGADIENDGGNLLNVDPRLKPLKNNGGPTNTHAFKKSPAKNKGPSDAPNSDQRGAPRKGKADIGAYELAKCKGVIVNRVGTAGKDKLKGTKKKDGILGLGGNDKLSGKKGKDGLCGGRGKDKLKGGPGKDKLDGGPGKDKEIQ